MALPVFAHVGLNCRDLDATEAFYCRHFGFQRARLIPLGEDRIVFLKAGDVYLELFNAKGEPPDPLPANDGPGYAGFRHLAFMVADVEATLRSMGTDAVVTLGPLAFDDFIPGWKSAWIRDPDGRIIELSQGYRDEGR
ncbi:MAG: VOC family protein [Thermodesulfobacteriota bacterium]